MISAINMVCALLRAFMEYHASLKMISLCQKDVADKKKHAKEYRQVRRQLGIP